MFPLLLTIHFSLESPAKLDILQSSVYNLFPSATKPSIASTHIPVLNIVKSKFISKTNISLPSPIATAS